jgi:spore maturation protein CgeB
MACEIPLIATQWDDTENLFTPGKDYLITNHKDETKDLIQLLLGDTLFRSTLTKRARDTISSRFSAEQRASELEVIYQTFFSKSNQDSK